MSKIITIKLIRVGTKQGPFTIKDQFGNIIASDVSRLSLSTGISYTVDDLVSIVTITSEGKCPIVKSFSVGIITRQEFDEAKTVIPKTGCMWKHLANPTIYNTFYGVIEPYIIEYPLSYQVNDEILQNVKDFTRAYKYFPSVEGVFDSNEKIQVNRQWFNKAVVYNNQQTSGLLILVPKPKNNLNKYVQYPILNSDSKTIIYTESDNLYQYNTFWSVVKDKTQPLFTKTCESLSIDKIVNQSNMDYSSRSFKKEPMRAKYVKIRHILDNASDLHLVSGFIIGPSMISYK